MAPDERSGTYRRWWDDPGVRPGVDIPPPKTGAHSVAGAGVAGLESLDPDRFYPDAPPAPGSSGTWPPGCAPSSWVEGEFPTDVAKQLAAVG